MAIKMRFDVSPEDHSALLRLAQASGCQPPHVVATIVRDALAAERTQTADRERLAGERAAPAA